MTAYATGSVVRRRSTRASRAVLVILTVMMAVLMAAVPMLSRAPAASAGWFENITCGKDLGAGTAYVPTDDTLANDELMSDGGKYSAMDLYKNSLKWTTYNGFLGDDTDKLDNFDVGSLKRVNVEGKEKTNVKEASETMRSGPNCIGRWASTTVANTLLGISGIVTNFMSVFVSYAVNPRVICQDPARPHTGCINLLPILGGNGAGQGGIIGALYNGIYLSLATLVAIILGVWMLIRAVKGEFRNSVFGIIWTVIAFVLFVMVLSQPLMLAEAPMKVSTTLGSCMVEALNGHSCLSSATPGGDSAQRPQDQLCLINPKKDVAADQRLALDSRMATCKLWKAFALEPWSEGQFGMSYESLETASTDLIGKSPSKDAVAYWKDVRTSLEADSTGRLCSSDRSLQSNIALYQLDLMTDVHDCKGSGGSDFHSQTRTAQDPGVYNDWYYLIDIMSQARTDNGTGAENISHSWNTWSGSSSGVRLSLGLVAVIASILAATIIIPSSIYALGYMFIGTILTVFAPLFMLVGLHPTVGRKMFLGWLEMEIGAVLKYFFMVLWVSVVVEIFGAILGSSTSNMITLAFVIAMTATLKAYRKELTNIFGNIDLGGKKLSNAIGQRFTEAAGKVKGLAGAYAGGELAGIVNGEGNIRDRLRSGHDMAKFQVMQQGKYMGGAIGNAFMSADKINDRRRNKMVKEAEEQNRLADEQANNAQLEAKNSEDETANEQAQGWGKSFDITAPTANSDNLAKLRSEEAAINSRPQLKGLNEVDKARDDARDIWNDRVNNAVTNGLVDSSNPDGIVRSNDTNDTDANEAAYRLNEQERSRLMATATQTTDDQGNKHYSFANDADRQKYEKLTDVLDDSTASAAHAQYRADEDAFAEMGAQDEFNTQMAAGNIDSSIHSLEELNRAGYQRDEDLKSAKSKYDHTASAIAGHTRTESLKRNASDLRAAADHIKSVNEEITTRTEGATYSGRERRRLEQRGIDLRTDIGNGGTGRAVMDNAEYVNAKRRVASRIASRF